MCQSQHNCVQRGNVTAKNKGTWAVSAEADDFFELSGGLLPPEDIALRYQSRPICVRRDSVTNKTKGAACSPLGAPLPGGYPRGAPLGSLLHPFLSRKGWRAVPAAKPRCGFNRNKVAGIAYSVSNKTKGASSRPGRGPPAGGGHHAGGQCPHPGRAPPGADIALMCQSQHGCGHRGQWF